MERRNRVWLLLRLMSLLCCMSLTLLMLPSLPGLSEVPGRTRDACRSWGSVAYAQRQIGLIDCINLTLGYSRDVLIAGENIKESEGFYIEQRAAALPHLTAEAKAFRNHDDSLKGTGAAEETGVYYGNLNITQPLFTWGQIGAAINAAKYDRASMEQRYREAGQLAMREAATSFYNYLLAVELERVARDNVAQKQRHLDETERKHQMEVATDYDVLASRVALTNAHPALTQAENDIRLTKDRLRYYMGLEEDFQVTGSLHCMPYAPETLEFVLGRAKANRPEIAYFENRVGVFKELIKVAGAGNKPRLDFKGNLGWGSYGHLTNDYPGEYWDAGIYLSFPFFDGFETKGKVMQAESRVAVTEAEMKKFLDNMALEARDAINRVDEAVQIVKGLEATEIQAARLLEMAESGYRHGVKTRLEVDDAEFNLLTARSNLARARRDYLTARTRLLWIMGEDLQTAMTRPNLECVISP